jgi:N-acetylglucosaminyldiphosphoundecaprenol N-acetyl-beta-D-mannosaminyltransferase
MSDSKDLRVAILGVAIDNLSMDEVLSSVEAKIQEGGFHQIATANVDFLIKSIHDEELYETLARCDLVLADGMPLVWASRRLGAGLKERVTGADLVPRLAKLSAQKGYRIFLLGADEESSAGTAIWMENNHPGVSIVGRYCPEHLPLEEMDHEEILSRIEIARPDILLVAFGNPKQEKWITMHRHRLEVPVCIGVGGSFDFLSGRLSRAPVWMQKSGMEWMYRTIQEPSRLGKRYLGNIVGLLRYLPLQIASMALQGRRRRSAQITTEMVGTSFVVRIDGDFTGTLLPQFESDVRSAVLSGSHVVLDMSNTAYIGADALASLIYVMNVARNWKRELWVAGMDRILAYVVGAARLRLFFRMAPKVTEALRRIQPEPMPIPRFGQDWAFCRIGGQLIPIQVAEVPDVYRQMHQLFSGRFRDELIPVRPRYGQELDVLSQQLVPEDAR